MLVTIQGNTMKLNDRKLSSIAEGEALEYAIYTVENRAIPNLIDGFKPVQRFVMHEALAKANGKPFVKLASVASGVSDAGYHHGENSAQEAGKLMANTWNNNTPLLEGQGNFGSRLVQEGAAARYIFCRVHENFNMLFKDHNIAPEHDDPEHKPPKYYLPVIPTVLLNGVRGIATGYSTNIHPYSIESVINSVEDVINNKRNIRTPLVKLPQFNGIINQYDDSKIDIIGVYEYTKRKNEIKITEIPIQFDREKYISVLDKLEEDGEITYTDHCGEHGFEFLVKLRNTFGLLKNPEAMDKHIKNKFKLVQASTEYIVVIDENGRLKDRNDFPTALDLIKHFVKVRYSFLDNRIKYMINKCRDDYNKKNARIEFIEKVINEEIIIKGKTREVAIKEIKKHKTLEPYADQLISMNLYHITKDEAERLRWEAKKAGDDLFYWEGTNAKEQYTNDLKDLKKLIKK